MLRLNVGVLFRNNKELINPFFFFLRKSMQDTKDLKDLSLRIIALDNGSEDGTSEELKKYIEKDDVLLRTDRNIGIARGRNLILEKIKETEGDYFDLLLLDSDVFIARQNSIDRMCEVMSKETSCGMVLGRILSFARSIPFEGSSGGICFCLIRKEVFEKCGIFDPQFDMFCDDTDLIQRIEKAGFLIQRCNEAVAVHIWGSTVFWGSEGKEIRKRALAHDKECYEKKWNCKIA